MILLTGATGFVGQAVLMQLLRRQERRIRTYGRRAPVGLYDHENAAQTTLHITGELSDCVDFSAALNDIDVVIHCAAQAHVMKPSPDHSNDIYWAANVEGTCNLARHAIAAGVKRFIFISSVQLRSMVNLPLMPHLSAILLYLHQKMIMVVQSKRQKRDCVVW